MLMYVFRERQQCLSFVEFILLDVLKSAKHAYFAIMAALLLVRRVSQKVPSGMLGHPDSFETL